MGNEKSIHKRETERETTHSPTLAPNAAYVRTNVPKRNKLVAGYITITVPGEMDMVVACVDNVEVASGSYRTADCGDVVNIYIAFMRIPS